MANYNKLDFLSNSFTTFEDVPTPKVYASMPLGDIDITDWAEGIHPESGTPIVRNKFVAPKMSVNNSEEVELQSQPNQPVNLSGNAAQIKSQPNQPVNLSGNAAQIKNFFIQKGLTPYAAAGIVGNLMVESGLRTDAVGDKGTSYGIAQWHNERWDDLKNFAKQNNLNESDLNTQLEFLYHELTNNKRFNELLDQLNNARNSDEATILFMDKFEVPSKETKLKTSKQRRQYAASALNS